MMSFAKEVQWAKANVPAIGVNGVKNDGRVFQWVSPIWALSPIWVSCKAAGTMRVVSEVQFEKAKWLMVFKPVGSVSLARAEQCEKASSQIMRSAVGSVRSTRAEQRLKVYSSILESALGRVSLTRRLQPLKADRPMFASVASEKSTLVREEQLEKQRACGKRAGANGGEGLGECEGARGRSTQRRQLRQCW